MTDAELVSELAAYGHDVSYPTNSHLPRDQRIGLAAQTPAGEHGLCPEAEDRLALRNLLRRARGEGASRRIIAAEQARQIAAGSAGSAGSA